MTYRNAIAFRQAASQSSDRKDMCRSRSTSREAMTIMPTSASCRLSGVHLEYLSFEYLD